MVDLVRLIVIIDITLLIIIEILCWIYLLTIICVKRLHTIVNTLTGNVCLAAIFCCLFWIIYYISSTFYEPIFKLNGVSCVFNSFLPEMFNSFMIYTIVMVTVNRYFTLIYPQNPLFKRKFWVLMCSIAPWILVFILTIPEIIQGVGVCIYGQLWIDHIEWHGLVIIIFLPTSINGIFNLLIFLHVRASTRRIRTMTTIYQPDHQPVNPQHTRDIHLLKHILFMFIVFAVGWTPIYLMSVIDVNYLQFPWLFTFLQVLPVISSLITVLDLFWYNRDLRRCLQDSMNQNLRIRRQN